MRQYIMEYRRGTDPLVSSNSQQRRCDADSHEIEAFNVRTLASLIMIISFKDSINLSSFYVRVY